MRESPGAGRILRGASLAAGLAAALAGATALEATTPLRGWSLLLGGLSLAAWHLAGRRPWSRRVTILSGLLTALVSAADLWTSLGGLRVAELPALEVLWQGQLVGILAGLGLALLPLDPTRVAFHPAPALSGAAAWFAVVESLAVVYAGQLGAPLPPLSGAGTAFLGLGLAVGVLVARPELGPAAILLSQSSGGTLARRLTPLVVAVPAGLGGLIVEGRAAGLFGVEMGTALFVAASGLVAFSVVLWRAVLLDRTEWQRRKVRDELRASEERFRGLVENSTDGFMLLSAESRIVYRSPSADRLVGYTPEERLGRSPLDLVYPEDLETVRAALAAALARPGEPVHSEFRLRRKDGDLVHIEAVTVNRLDTPALRALVVNYRDVTERRRMEQQLRRSEARHRAILDSSLEALIGMGADGRVSYWNPRAETVFGWTREEALGRTVAELIIPPRHREAHVLGLKRYLRDGAGPVLSRRIEIEALRRDGAEFPVELTVVALPGHEEVEFYAFLSDIAERRKLEEQLRQSRKMDAVGQLAGGIAHDFNNLLNVILGYGDLLLREPLQERTRQRVVQIGKAAERAATLTRQLLAFSRKQMLQPRVLDLNAVVSDMEEMLRRLIGEQIALVTARGVEPARAKVDKGQLEQVIVNLAVNARDAMPDGGSLVLETAAAELDAEFARGNPGATPGRHVVLAVSDDGVGMDAATRERIFEPFFTTKEMGKGTGLGLSTVYGIVKQSGGYISVYSEPGHGTTFRVYLPESAEDLAGEDAPAGGASSPRGAGTILLAEDDPSLRDLLREMLEGEGYRVLAAPNGEAALAAAHAHPGPIHLLVSDVVMPGMTGPELARRLARTQPAVRALFLSGYAQSAVTQRGVLPPGVHFLVKPFGHDALLQKVRELLNAGPS